MKSPAFTIICKTNPEAILMSRLIEEGFGIVCDCRESNSLVYSKEALSRDAVDKEDLLEAVEDACMVGELDYTPEIIETEFDFEKDES